MRQVAYASFSQLSKPAGAIPPRFRLLSSKGNCEDRFGKASLVSIVKVSLWLGLLHAHTLDLYLRKVTQFSV